MEPLITICIPIYNSAEYIDKCLKTITEQTYHNLEILMVIDGKMHDNSVELCDEWSKKDDRIKVIQQEHGGLPVARNTALDNARGDYIGFVDPDDYIEPDMYERLFSGLSECGAELCIEGYIEQDEGKDDGVSMECYDKILSSSEAVSMMINGIVSDYPWNKLYKKELFDGLRYPENNNFYDVGTTYKFLERSKSVRLIPYAGYHYIRRKGSLTGGRRISDFLDSIEMHIARYDDLKERRSDLIDGLCRGIYGSCVSLAAAEYVSGKRSRIENRSRIKKNELRIREIKRENTERYSLIRKIIMDMCTSSNTLALFVCLGLEQIRRWMFGK